MKKFWRSIYDVLDDVLAYVLTVVGILSSNALELMKSNTVFSLDLGGWRIIAAMIIAFIFVGKQEYIKPDDVPSNRAASREGRRKNFKMRMANALAQGVMWSQAMDALKLL